MTQADRDNLVVIGVLMGVIVATAALVYFPQQRKLRDLRSRIARQKLRLVATGKKATAVPEMLRTVQNMRQRYGDFDRQLPQRKEIGGFLREISGNLSEEALANQSIEPENPTQQKLFHTLPILLRFQGSYLSLASLLKRLEKMERLTQVQRLSITNGTGAKREGVQDRLDIELRMHIYFTES